MTLRRRRARARSSTIPSCSTSRRCSRRRARPRAWRSRTSACRRSCARSWPSCASRARASCEAGDEERRRLERDLHDGAQQRLLGIGMALQLARASVDGDATATALLDETDAEVRAALDELRELARGIHPAVLTDQGLAAAVRTLAERAPVPVEVTRRRRAASGARRGRRLLRRRRGARERRQARARLACLGRRSTRADGSALVEVRDDGVGGADPARLRPARARRPRRRARRPSRAREPARRRARACTRRSRAGRDRRRRARSCARASRGCSPRPGSRSRRGGDAARAARARRRAAARTSRSSTSACRRPTPTRGSSPRRTIRERFAGRRRARPLAVRRAGLRAAACSTAAEGGCGYLLKDRVLDASELVAALERVAAAETRGRPDARRRSCSPAGATRTRSTSSPSASARCSR